MIQINFFYPSNYKTSVKELRKKKKVLKSFTKVQKMDKFIENELFYLKILSQNSDYKEYIYIYNFEMYNNSKLLRKDTTQKYILMYFENSYKKIENINITKLTKSNLYFLISTYKQLLHNFLKISQNNIIKNNMCYTHYFEYNENLVLNDFRLAFKYVQDEKENETMYENTKSIILNTTISNTFLWPIEKFVIYLLENEKIFELTSLIIKDIIEQFVENNIYLKELPINILEQYKEECNLFLSKYLGKNRKKIIYELMLFSNTWDNYSLNCFYNNYILNLINVYESNTNSSDGTLENIQLDKWLQFFFKLTLLNIYPNPLKRKTLLETITLFEKNCENNILRI